MDPQVAVPFDVLRRAEVVARDGPLGRLETFLFDDGWTVRWLVVTPEGGPRMLISPQAVERWDPTVVSLHLAGPAGNAVHTAEAERGLASAEQVLGAAVQACDGPVGRLSELVVDAATWAVRWLDVDTQTGWPSRHVLLSPHGLARLTGGRIVLDATAEQVRAAPTPPAGLRSPL